MVIIIQYIVLFYNIFQSWGNIQSLLCRTGRESIKHRLKEFQEQGGQVDKHLEKQVEQSLSDHHYTIHSFVLQHISELG